MKKKTLAKRIVSFITALSLSISSTIMVLPASAEGESEVTLSAEEGDKCTCDEDCNGTYHWVPAFDYHILSCDAENKHDVDGSKHNPGEFSDKCTLCAAMPVITIEEAVNGNLYVSSEGKALNTGDKVALNASLNISADPDTGYTFSLIKYKKSTDVDWTTSTDYSVAVDATESLTIRAEFAPIDYQVAVSAPDEKDGTIEVDKEKANVGDTVTITVKPASGRNFIDLPTVSYGGNNVDVTKVEDGEYTFEMPASGVTVSGDFGELTYEASPGPNDGISAFMVNEVRSGSNFFYIGNNDVVTIIPEDPETGRLIEYIEVSRGNDFVHKVYPDENGKYTFKPIDVGVKCFGYSNVGLDIKARTVQGYQLNLTNPTITGSENPALTIVATVDGKEVSSGTYLKEGTKVNLSYEANEDYNFTDWSVSGATVGDDNTFTMPAGKVDVTATCTEKTYSVQIAGTENGNVTVTYGTGDNETTLQDNAALTAGELVTITAKPDQETDGKEFVVDEVKVTKNGVTGDNEVTLTKIADDKYTFTMPRNAVTINVTFKQVYEVIINQPKDATVTATYVDDNTEVSIGDKHLAEGTAVKVRVDGIAEGYAVESVKYNSTDITATLSNGYYSFKMPAEAVSIEVTLVRTYTVSTTIVGGEHGTVAPCSGYSFENVKAGDEVRFTVVPAEGYGVSELNVSYSDLDIDWDIKTDTYGSILYYYFKMPDDGNVTICASFNRIYTLTKADTENGSFTLSSGADNPEGKAFYGDEVRISANPDDNCIVKSVKYSYGGNDYTLTKDTEGAYTFIMPDDDVTVSVVFERVYKVNSDIGEKGKLVPCEGIDFDNVFYGDEVRFTIEPIDGYAVNGVSISSESSGYVNISLQNGVDGKFDYYYFEMPASDVNVNVNFEKVYSATATAEGNGKITLEYDDETPIETNAKLFVGDEIVVKVQPDDGYKLAHVQYSYMNEASNTTESYKVDEYITPVRGIYSFNMPAANVEVSALFVKAKPVFTVSIGGDTASKDTDKWADVLSFINENCSGTENVTVSLNEDYTFTSKDKLPAANKVGTLVFEGAGTLTFDKSVAALKLVSDTELSLKTASEKKINVTVAADKLFRLGSDFSGNILGKVTGTKTSLFEVHSRVNVDQLSTFRRIVLVEDAELTVNGSISAIDWLIYACGSENKPSNGLTVSGAKSTVDVNNVEIGELCETAVINLVQGADGKFPKLTVGEAIKLTINVVDSNGEIVDLESGTTVAYSKSNDISERIAIGNKMGSNDLKAFYYPKTKAIKAEYYVLSVAEKGGKAVPYPNIEAAFEAMKENKDYILTLNDNVTVPSKLALPRGIKSLTIDDTILGTKTEMDPTTDEDIDVNVYAGYTITFTAAKLAIPYDVTFNVNFAVSNNKDLIDITVAKDSALVFNNAVGDIDPVTYELKPCINKITGTNTSTLGAYWNEVVSDDDETHPGVFNNIATFGKLNGFIIVNGTVTGVTELEGTIILGGEKSSAVVENVAFGSRITLYKNSKGEVPKFTITDIVKDANGSAPGIDVGVFDRSLNEIGYRYGRLATGTTVLYTKGNDLSDKIAIINRTGEGKNLSAVYYEKTKSIKAECESAVAVYASEDTLVGTFKNLDEAVEAINSQTGTNAYTIVLSTAVTADAKFAFPKSTKTNTISSIRIMSEDQYKDESEPGEEENEESMSAPDSGNELLMWDDGVSITFTGTKLAIPYDMEIDVPVKASNKNDLIDITVAKDVALYLFGGSGDLDYSTMSVKCYINKLSGTKTSALFIGGPDLLTIAKSVSNFGEVYSWNNLAVEGPVTGIGYFDGVLSLFGEKASAVVENVKSGSITLYKNSKGAVPKLTVTDIGDNLRISVFNFIMDTSKVLLESGTVVAYTKGNDLSKKISIDNSDISYKSLTPVFDKSKKTITAVNSQALTLYEMTFDAKEGKYLVDESVKPVNASSFDELVKLINDKKYAKGDKLPYYQIKVSTSLELPASFALPKATQASGMIITNDGGSSVLTFTGTKLAVPYDLTIDIGLIADNKTRRLDINVAKDCDLNIDDGYADNDGENCFGKVTGSGTSTLSYIGRDETFYPKFTGISGFNKVMGNIVVEGAITKIGEFSGNLDIYGEKASADINRINALTGKTESTVCLYLNSKGELPKITIGSIADGVKLNYCPHDYYQGSYYIGSGKTILYTKTADFADTDQIKIERAEGFSASFDSKTKSVKAVADGPVLLSVIDDANNKPVPVNNGSDGKFATLEEAVAYIDKNGSSTTGYYISLSSNIECSKLTLPKAGRASELVIDCSEQYYSINVGKTASITSNMDLTLINAYFETNAKSFTINAKGNVDLLGDNGGINAIKGGAKNTLTVDGSSICDVTGFGTVNVADASMFGIETTLKTNDLVLGKNAIVGFWKDLKSVTFSSLKAAKDAGFMYFGIPKNVPKFTGKAENFKVHKDGFYILGYPSEPYNSSFICPGSKILSTNALTDLSIFKFFNLALLDTSETPEIFSFKQVGNDICLSAAESFGLSSDKNSKTQYFSRWEDAVNAINAANDSSASYTIEVNDIVEVSKLTFPAKGKYKELVVSADYNEYFPICIFTSGAITLTGNTTFENITIVEPSSKADESYVSYNVNASGYDVVLDNAYLVFASVKAKNVTIKDLDKYDEFAVNKLDVTDTLTVTSDDSDNTVNLATYYLATYGGITAKNMVLETYLVIEILDGKKLNVTDTLLTFSKNNLNPATLEIGVIDEDGMRVENFAKNYSLGKIKNGANWALLYDSDGYTILPDSNGNLCVVRSLYEPYT